MFVKEPVLQTKDVGIDYVYETIDGVKLAFEDHTSGEYCLRFPQMCGGGYYPAPRPSPYAPRYNPYRGPAVNDRAFAPYPGARRLPPGYYPAPQYER